VSKEFLKVERFRKTFELNRLDLDPEQASRLYLESLANTVVLIDGALALCKSLAKIGEIGIITNGVEQIQQQRIVSSGLGDHISFVATSEACGHAKPDVRFFEFAAMMAKSFAKNEAIIVGDRLDADLLGANHYGTESCWFNPGRLPNNSRAVPTYEVAALADVVPTISG